MRAADASSGDWIAVRPRCCCSLRYMKVRHHYGMRTYVYFGLRMRAGMRGLRGFCTAFAGDANSSFQWLKGRSFGGATGRPKGTAKVLHFQRKCCISVFGAPDQSEKGAKKGENGGAAGAGFRADSGRKIGAGMRLFAVGLVQLLYRFCGCSGDPFRIDFLKPGCIQMYMKFVTLSEDASQYQCEFSYNAGGSSAAFGHCSGRWSKAAGLGLGGQAQGLPLP